MFDVSAGRGLYMVCSLFSLLRGGMAGSIYAARAATRPGRLFRVVGWMRDSAGIPSAACNRLIIVSVSGRRRFNISETRLLLPNIFSRLRRVSLPCYSRTLMASIGSGGAMHQCLSS